MCIIPHSETCRFNFVRNLDLLRNGFVPRNPPCRLSFGPVRCDVVNLCFVHGYQIPQKLLWVTVEQHFRSFHKIVASCEQRWTQNADYFRTLKCFAHSSDRWKSKLLSHVLWRWLLRSCALPISIVSGVATSVGRPDHSASIKLVRPQSNSVQTWSSLKLMVQSTHGIY